MKRITSMSAWDFDGMSIGEIKENLNEYKDSDVFEVTTEMNWGNTEECVIRILRKEDNT